MKFLVAEVVTAVRSRRGRRNLRVLTRFFVILAAMIVVYSIVFHVLMQREGHEHTWINTRLR
jgi:preprotein translocase subunit SecG